MVETLMKYGAIFQNKKPFEEFENEILIKLAVKIKAECCGKYRKFENLIPKDGKLVCKYGTGCKRKSKKL